MYLIKYFDEYDKENWENVNYLNIASYSWDKKGYRPKTKVKLFHTDEAIHIKFIATEKEVIINIFENNGPVYRDSCVEFFFAPCKSDERYINFEVNAVGILLLQIGTSIKDREFILDVDYSIFNIETSVNEGNLKEFNDFKEWTVEYKIPFEFIKKYYKDFSLESNYSFKGNFYKCGEETEAVHYGSWNPIEYYKPSFHRPEFFGKLILE